jgi:hypothetical protein
MSGWGTLIGIYREAAQRYTEETNAEPVACPQDGEPLERGPDGRLFCPWGDWRQQ